MKKDDRNYLDHILESFSKLVRHWNDIAYQAFMADEEKQDAVIRKIEIAGEASKRVSQELRTQFPQTLD